MVLCRPVFVTRYPRRIKPFYMKTDELSLRDGPQRETVLCLDLLVPAVGELMGGSEREDSYERLERNMTAAGLKRASLPVVPRPAKVTTALTTYTPPALLFSHSLTHRLSVCWLLRMAGAGMEVCRTAGSGWASSASYGTSRAWPTCAISFPYHAHQAACTSSWLSNIDTISVATHVCDCMYID